MGREIREKIKLLTLIVLIFTSVLQVGILWSYQNHGLPINFLMPFLSGSSSDDNDAGVKAASDFFKPSRIIISQGWDENHWPLNDKSDDFGKLWKDACEYLKLLPGTKPDQVRLDQPRTDQPKVEAKSEWQNVISKKSFVYEFRTPIPVDIASWFLGLGNATWGDIKAISKLAVVPWEDVNQNINTIYVLDDNTVYRYSLPVSEKAFSRDESRMAKDKYREIIDRLKNSRSGERYRYPMELLPLGYIRPDILFAVNGSKSIYNIVCAPSGELAGMMRWSKMSDIRGAAGVIVGREKDSYEADIDENDAKVFKNLNNIFKVHNDGLLEYRYKSGSSEIKGSRVDAFRNSVAFVNARANLVTGAELQLSGISEVKDGYMFTFDYTVDDVPVFIDGSRNGSQPVKNAVTLVANGQRVLNCTWLVRSFRNEKSASYSISLERVLDSLFVKYPGLRSEKGLYLQDIQIGYRIERVGEQPEAVAPVWVLSTKEGRRYQVDMER